MKKIFKLILLILPVFVLIACDNAERRKAAGEKIQGTTQETVGDLTNDSDMKTDGKINKTKSDLRSTKEDVKDFVTGD